MLWFFLSLATAFLAGTEGALVKGYFSDLKPLELAAYPLAYSLPFFAVALLFIQHPPLAPDFWQTMVILVPLNLLGYVSYMNGIALAPLSLSMPFLSFTPVVAIFTGLLFLDEMPTGFGALGICTIVAGSYVLNIEKASAGHLLEPFRAILRERGTVLVLFASVVFGFCAVLGKVLVLQSSPIYAGTMFFMVHNAVFLSAVLLFRRVRLATLLQRPKPGLFVGIMIFGHICFHFWAISLVQAAYMVAVKRLSGLFGVIYGGILFKEKHIGTRLAGAACMSLGAALIALLG